MNGEDDSEASEKWKNIDDDASESDEDDNVSLSGRKSSVKLYR